jgi:CO/xanthine dehydrogenase FAD-binding subunit
MASYLRPVRLSEALEALAAGPRVLLAGGTDHYPARAVQAPGEDILDLTALPSLRAIVQRDGEWFLPCLATWTDIVRAPLPPAFDALKQAARQVGGVQIQNQGTLAGNICNASPAADSVPCLLALDARVVLASARGERVLPLVDFILGPRRTARRPDELVLGLRIPAGAAAADASCFLKLGARRYLVISIAMVAASARLDREGRITEARVAVGACSPVAVRLPALEAALEGRHPAAELVTPSHLAPLTPIDDIRAPAAYRRGAALELVRRAVVGLRAREIAA